MGVLFYLPSTGAAAVSPAFEAGWEQTGEADRIAMIRVKDTPLSAMTNKTVTIPITTTQDILARQYVSEPLPFAMTIDGQVSGVVRVLEATANGNAAFSVIIRVVSNDGSTFRGTLLTLMNNGVEFATSGATRIVPLTAVTNVDAQVGDRIVIEIGLTATTPVAGDTGTFRFGTGVNTDFALTAALATDLKPWFRFTADLFLQARDNNHQYISVGDGTGASERIK